MSRIYGLILSIGIVVIALDQWTKHLALQAFTHEGDSAPFLSWFHFTLVHNYGAAFGMLRNLPESIRGGFFFLLPLVILSVLWWSHVRHFSPKESLGPIAIGLVFGGAIGNLIDRIRHGYVIDFIDWFYKSDGSCLPQFFKLTPDTCHWPVFNVADSAITLAIALLAIYTYQQGKREALASSGKAPAA